MLKIKIERKNSDKTFNLTIKINVNYDCINVIFLKILYIMLLILNN